PPPPSGYTYYPEQQSAPNYGQPGAGYAQPGNPGPGYGQPGYPGAGYAQPGNFGPGYGQPGYPGAGYGQPVFAAAPVYAQPDPRKGHAITGFVLGLLSLLLWIIPFVGGFLDILLGILGLVFSVLGLKSTTARGLGVAGLVLSIIGLAIAAITVITL